MLYLTTSDSGLGFQIRYMTSSPGVAKSPVGLDGGIVSRMIITGREGRLCFSFSIAIAVIVFVPSKRIAVNVKLPLDVVVPIDIPFMNISTIKSGVAVPEMV
jgi:hypothetical protein